MRLYLINPANPLVGTVNLKASRWNQYHLWKPLNLMIIAGLTSQEWDITIFDENKQIEPYNKLPKPDLVGITSFTSQAPRAYEVAAYFKGLGIPVVMGGIHATMCVDEALKYVNTVVTGEAESVWAEVLKDFRRGTLKCRYNGGLADLDHQVLPRHDLLQCGYKLGAIQTTRGCPLNCHFCSVTKFNGARYRQRPITNIIEELKTIKERWVLIVDDNLVGTKPEHFERAKALFRAMIKEKIKKKWFTQVTINFADDEELLSLAARSGCSGVFIGLESHTPDGLRELGKQFNFRDNRDIRASIRRIQKHKILVLGSFIIGLDVHNKGIGSQIAKAALHFGLDLIAILYMTPLPGTRLWDRLKAESRILFNSTPENWKYYTFELPIAHYKQLTMKEVVQEMTECTKQFCTTKQLLYRLIKNVVYGRKPVFSFIANMQVRDAFHTRWKANEIFLEKQGFGKTPVIS